MHPPKISQNKTRTQSSDMSQEEERRLLNLEGEDADDDGGHVSQRERGKGIEGWDEV